MEPEALPEATQDSTDEPSLPGLDPVEDSGSAATANDSTLGASATVTPAWNRRRLALFGGAGAAGLGALLVGVGSVYGLDSRSTKGSITNSTDQRTAVRLGDEANASASKANTLFIIGSIALTVGGSAAAVAWFQPQWLGGDTLAVAPTPDGRGLAVAGRW